MSFLYSDFVFYLYDKEISVLKMFKYKDLDILLNIQKEDNSTSDVIYNTTGAGHTNIANKYEDGREYHMDDKYPDWKEGRVVFIDGHSVAKYKVFFSDGDNEHAVYIKPKCQVIGPNYRTLEHLEMWNWDNFGTYRWYDDSKAIIGIRWPEGYNPLYISYIDDKLKLMSANCWYCEKCDTKNMSILKDNPCWYCEVNSWRQK